MTTNRALPGNIAAKELFLPHKIRNVPDTLLLYGVFLLNKDAEHKCAAAQGYGVQVSDTTGDAMKNKCLHKNISLHTFFIYCSSKHNAICICNLILVYSVPHIRIYFFCNSCPHLF